MRVAVLGAGGTIAPAIVRDLAESDEVSELLLLDLDAERALAVAESHGGDKAFALGVDAREGLSEADLASAKSQLKGQITLSLESPSSRMYRAAGTELYGEPYRTLDETLALIDGITLDEVASVSRDFFAPERQTILSLGPEAAA